LKLEIEVKIGEPLLIDRFYMEGVHATLYQLAVRLAQISWRNCRADQLREQDIFLQNICFELLQEKRYSLARDILDFASTIRKTSDEEMQRMFCINRAIACKFGGREEQVDKILAKFDWSAAAPKYKLALLVLKDQYDRVVEMLPSVPDDHENGVTVDSYREWPLFRELRLNHKFRSAFQLKFGESLESTTLEAVTEEGQKDLDEGASADAMAPASTEYKSETPEEKIS
jgi:hypothetical protein